MSDETTTAEPSTTVDSATTEATVTDTATGETTETSYADGTFKSISDLEKGYTELRSSYSKKLGKFDGSPEDGYKYTDEFAKNDFIDKWGTENQLSQTGLESLVTGYENYQNEQTQAFQEEQVKLLGDEAQTRMANVADFLKANLGEDHSVDAQSAKGIESIEKLIAMSKQTAPAVQEAKPSYDKEQIKAMRFAVDPNSGERKMSIDPAYRAKVEKIEQEMYNQSH